MLVSWKRSSQSGMCPGAEQVLEQRTYKLGVELGKAGLALAVEDQECVDHDGDCMCVLG